MLHLLDISIGSAHTLHAIKLDPSRMHTRRIPCLLSPQQKNASVEACQYLMKQVDNNANYLNNVITTDAMWIYCYNHRFMQQTSARVVRGSLYPLQPCVIKLKMKSMVNIFFNRNGLVYTHTQCKMVKQSMWIGLSKSWSSSLQCILNVSNCILEWKLHYHNVCPHTVQHVWDFTSHWRGSDSSKPRACDFFSLSSW